MNQISVDIIWTTSFHMALERKTLLETKKSHIKMFKTALFDCAINEKCCSVDGGRSICPLFSSPPRGIWQLKSPQAQLELTDALSSLMYSITVLCKTLSFCPLVILCFSEGFSPTEWVSSYSLEIEVGSSNNDNACLISSFFLIAHWTFLFSCDILYYTSN